MKQSLCEALSCFESGSKLWKAIWWTTKSDTLQYLEIQLVHLCLRWSWNCSFFPWSRQSQSDTRSDTLWIPFWDMNAHKSILSHMACLVQCSSCGCVRKDLVTSATHGLHWARTPLYEPTIMSTDNRNLIHISDCCITVSYVDAPNIVKWCSDLRKTIPISHRAPFTYWVLPAAHVLCSLWFPYGCMCDFTMFACVFWLWFHFTVIFRWNFNCWFFEAYLKSCFLHVFNILFNDCFCFYSHFLYFEMVSRDDTLPVVKSDCVRQVYYFGVHSLFTMPLKY